MTLSAPGRNGRRPEDEQEASELHGSGRARDGDVRKDEGIPTPSCSAITICWSCCRRLISGRSQDLLESGQTHPMAVKKSPGAGAAGALSSDEAAPGERARGVRPRLARRGAGSGSRRGSRLGRTSPWVLAVVIHSAGLASSLAEAKRLSPRAPWSWMGSDFGSGSRFPRGSREPGRGEERFARVKLVPKRADSARMKMYKKSRQKSER